MKAAQNNHIVQKFTSKYQLQTDGAAPAPVYSHPARGNSRVWSLKWGLQACESEGPALESGKWPERQNDALTTSSTCVTNGFLGREPTSPSSENFIHFKKSLCCTPTATTLRWRVREQTSHTEHTFMLLQTLLGGIFSFCEGRRMEGRPVGSGGVNRKSHDSAVISFGRFSSFTACRLILERKGMTNGHDSGWWKPAIKTTKAEIKQRQSGGSLHSRDHLYKDCPPHKPVCTLQGRGVISKAKAWGVTL